MDLDVADCLDADVVAMAIVKPETWYIAFWIGVGIVALTPIYVLLVLIYRKL